MGLLTPSTGLLFWMVIIFGLVFFLLAKFGFPVITSMVKSRQDHINSSLEEANQAKEKVAAMQDEYEKMMHKAREEQDAMLAEARKSARQIIDEAKAQASIEAKALLDRSKADIEKQKHDAINEVRGVVAQLSVALSEKILREKLSTDAGQAALMDKLIQELEQDRTS